MKLTDIFIRNVKPTNKVQKYSDGWGLYLHVAPTGGKLWRMAYRFNGKQKLLSIGAYPAVSLKEARNRRETAREQLAVGIDPNVSKQESKAAVEALALPPQNTFEIIAKEWFAKYAPTLSPKHALKLQGYLDKVLLPSLAAKTITELEPSDLLAAVKPAESKGHHETAHKLMQLCDQVLRYAKITGRTKYNVATDLTGALQTPQVTHFAAITAPNDIGTLLRDIDEYQGHFSVVYCLKILPYVFTRPSELRLAEWSEFHFDEKLWRIPAKRMKMRREHTVPLAKQVIALLQELQKYSGSGGYLFPSIRTAVTPISDMAPLAALRRLGYGKEEMCLHGFRAMASTCLNELGFRGDVIEAQLAHKEQDAVRLAYNRAEYLKERRDMMQKWADYLCKLKQGTSNAQ